MGDIMRITTERTTRDENGVAIICVIAGLVSWQPPSNLILVLVNQRSRRNFLSLLCASARVGGCE